MTEGTHSTACVECFRIQGIELNDLPKELRHYRNLYRWAIDGKRVTPEVGEAALKRLERERRQRLQEEAALP